MKNKEPVKIDESSNLSLFKIEKERITGVDLIENSILERRRIMNKKLKDKNMNEHFYKL